MEDIRVGTSYVEVSSYMNNFKKIFNKYKIKNNKKKILKLNNKLKT